MTNTYTFENSFLGVLEPFLFDYIQTYHLQSIDTNVFKSFFTGYFEKKGLGSEIADIDWDRWLFTPGMPPIQNQYDQSLKEACSSLKNRWVEWDTSTPNPFKKSDLYSLFSDQVVQFLV